VAERQATRISVPPALVAVAFVAVCFLAAGVGQFFGTPGPNDWYRNLRKPAFTPPSWLFGPAWTVLYLCMGIAAWLVWRRRGLRGGAVPLLLFAGQLALNAAWTPLFFGLRNPALAFADIIVLWGMIALTMVRFFSISRAAGWLMAPYLGWTTFAAVLNFALWRMNG
jgi:benzodiazapine receptor